MKSSLARYFDRHPTKLLPTSASNGIAARAVTAVLKLYGSPATERNGVSSRSIFTPLRRRKNLRRRIRWIPRSEIIPSSSTTPLRYRSSCPARPLPGQEDLDEAPTRHSWAGSMSGKPSSPPRASSSKSTTGTRLSSPDGFKQWILAVGGSVIGLIKPF